ncbi:MAG: type I methionyl aminopeptidase [Coprobacillaceae bacterium]
MERNEPCWCKSGKKYKNCHLHFDDKLQILERKGYKIPPQSMIKNEEQIIGIRKASDINTALLDAIEQQICVGMSTEEIDIIAKNITEDNNAVCADYQYQGFPKHICTSINDVVCHGIPSTKDVLKDGDIINVDATTMLNGYYGDASRMFLIGKVDEEAKKLVEVTKECLIKGMESIIPYESCIGDIGKAIEKHAKQYGYGVVRELCGHGVGLAIHEEPNIVHYNTHDDSYVIVPGMVFTIEPMINQGTREICLDEDDGWTIYTVDGGLSAQWEHTFLVTESGVEILTK